MHVSDWFPTLVEGVAGGDISDLELDGFNVWPTISQNDPSPRTELLHNIDPFRVKEKSVFSVEMTAAIRVGDWKLLTGDPGIDKGSWTPVPNSGIKPVKPVLKPNQRVWLFNIKEDPYEKNDLSETHPDIVDEMIEKLGYYYNTSVPVNYPPDDPKANPAYHEGVWGPWL